MGLNKKDFNLPGKPKKESTTTTPSTSSTDGLDDSELMTEEELAELNNPWADEDEDKEWYWMFLRWQYDVYLGLVGIPWVVMGAILVFANFLINIMFNDGWAGGNIFLIANTAYLVIQYLLSVLLFLEIDPWLKYMKFIRIGSLWISCVYLFNYIFFTAILIWVLENLDGSEITYLTMYTVMVLAYNLMLHLPVLAVNLAIILKEISMEFIQFLYDVALTPRDDYSLAIRNFEYLFIDLSNWVNPWFWAEEDATGKWDDMYE